MDERITNIIKDWVEGEKLYSFEIRAYCPVSSQYVLQNPPSIPIVFIIDVQGFFYDKDHTQPIKLHYENDIAIPNTIVKQQDIDNFKQNLELLTQNAYVSFEDTLKSCPQPTYTSDILHMKD